MSLSLLSFTGFIVALDAAGTRDDRKPYIHACYHIVAQALAQLSSVSIRSTSPRQSCKNTKLETERHHSPDVAL